MDHILGGGFSSV
jgi:hypothetical protein